MKGTNGECLPAGLYRRAGSALGSVIESISCRKVFPCFPQSVSICVNLWPEIRPGRSRSLESSVPDLWMDRASEARHFCGSGVNPLMKLSDQPAKFSFRLCAWLPGLLLVAATLIAFLPAWHAGFIWDDDAYVTLNPLLTASDGLRRIWFSLDSPSQYFPLTFTTFYFERGLWGLNPMGYHVVNILLHAANALLVWRLLLAMRVPGAWLAAALFALHPVQVESVAWITERKNVLMGFFFLLTLWEWRRFIDEKTTNPWRHYVLALICCALSLTAKTTACTLPAAMLLMLWLEKRPINRRRLAQIGPFVLMGIGMGLLTMWWERYHQNTQGKAFNLSAAERLLVACRALWFYAGKLIWPSNLTFSYPRWKISASDPGAWGWVAATAALAAVICFIRRWTGRSLEVAAAYFVATLGPMLGFIMLYTFLYSFVADHYQYMACIGPLALAAAGIETGMARWESGKLFAQPAVYAALLLTVGALTWRQCQTYTTQETLWRSTIERNPECWMAENDLGAILYDKGQVNEAITLFQKALANGPHYAEVHNNFGAALDKEGKLDEAIAQFQDAVAIRPYFAEALRNLGDALLRKGRVQEAIPILEKAVSVRPDIAKSHHTLADALLRNGQVDEAIFQYQETLKNHPENAQGHYELGVLLLKYGRKAEAIAEFRNAIATRPDFAEAYNNLGYSLLGAGQTDDAIGQLRKALEIRPGYAQAHYNLGNAFLTKGQVDQAIIQFQQLLALQPDSSEARRTLAGIAWRLATSPNGLMRNGAEAVNVAEQLNRLTKESDPMIGAILAAAYGEAGQFDRAIATAARALEMATRQGNTALVTAIQTQLKTYRSGVPFRDTAARP